MRRKAALKPINIQQKFSWPKWVATCVDLQNFMRENCLKLQQKVREVQWVLSSALKSCSGWPSTKKPRIADGTPLLQKQRFERRSLSVRKETHQCDETALTYVNRQQTSAKRKGKCGTDICYLEVPLSYFSEAHSSRATVPRLTSTYSYTLLFLSSPLSSSSGCPLSLLLIVRLISRIALLELSQSTYQTFPAQYNLTCFIWSTNFEQNFQIMDYSALSRNV